jgi:IS4 transposase
MTHYGVRQERLGGANCRSSNVRNAPLATAGQQTGKQLVFLTNNFALDAPIIAKLYKYRWQVELFFKWIKQHLRIKAFFGTSENHAWPVRGTNLTRPPRVNDA